LGYDLKPPRHRSIRGFDHPGRTGAETIGHDPGVIAAHPEDCGTTREGQKRVASLLIDRLAPALSLGRTKRPGTEPGST
ncbi:MAG: hypothetical protein ACC726_12460, partial [Chloroflexota bacterium]